VRSFLLKAADNFVISFSFEFGIFPSRSALSGASALTALLSKLIAAAPAVAGIISAWAAACAAITTRTEFSVPGA
jgi:hypothetical protein